MNSTLPTRLLCAIALLLLIASSQLLAQPYRYWSDTTLPKEVVPTHVGPNAFPIGIYFYHYNHNYPATDIWTYVDSVNADHAFYFVERFEDGYRNDQDRWQRYTGLLASAPSGLGVAPIPVWKVSVLGQIDRSREVTFYPFDSSQLGGIALTGMEFFVYGHDYEVNTLTSFNYDTTEINELHRVEEDYDPRGQQPRREAHYDTGMANQTVASGVAFDYKPSQTERWAQTWDDSLWVSTADDNRIRTSTYFDGAGYDTVHAFRSPHFLVLTGRLFPSGALAPAGGRIRVDVYYEVGYGQTYIDSNDVLQTADTNLRFLYKSIEWTKDDLKPVDDVNPDWTAHRIIAKRIDFDKEGMGGPSAEGVTARGIDLEVVYLGGEKVALHSVAIRDSIAHSMLREDATGDAFRTAMKQQIDSLLQVGTGTTYPKTAPDGIHNLYITDEPSPFSALALRRAKQEIEQNYRFANGDSLTTGNGWALPHLQWNGGMDWTANGSYYTHYTGNLGQAFGLTFRGETPMTIPSEKHHNGGRLTVPEFFDIDSLGNPDYRATMAGRIDTMNHVMQYARLGAALPDTVGNKDFWLVESLYESAMWARLSGTRHRSFVGPVNAFVIRISDSTLIASDTTMVDTTEVITNYYTYQRDTILEHRPERSETRLLVGLSLAYGAKHLSYYTFESIPWARMAAEDTILVKDFSEIGLCGLGIDDRFINVLDWKLLDPNAGNGVQDTNSSGELLPSVTYDSLGVIEDLYVGWWDTYREIRQTNAWVRRIAPTLMSLRWRDAYSIHFAVDAPYTTHDNGLPHRPLPSTEIVSSVTTRHPITGVVDPAHATYVELGFFDTKRTTDSSGIVDKSRDSNYIMVVNRRSTETGNYDQSDIGYSTQLKAILDTLSETRTITIEFNLRHPDTTQYSFLRVRELEPDTATPLPLIGIRSGLDTVVRGDSAIEITLGAGRSALLEVTYAPPDTSIIDGLLHWNNQRKMIYFDDDRYHATYLRNDSVLHRRSMRMAPNPGSILWEPSETVVSIGPQRTTTQNWTPSITGSVHNGDTVVTIVWTCHSDSSGVRDVVLHDLLLNGGGQPVKQSIRHLDYHSGTDSTQVGDAVIAAMHGGDVIAWGDSQLGVVSRVRLRSAPGAPTVLSNRALVSQPYHDTVNNRVGKWPALPSFAHRASADSNVAIVWNQPIGTGVNARIYYQRVLQNPIVGTVPGIALLNFTPVSWNPSPIGRPSIDQTQDLWHRLQEGITFSQDRGATTSDLIWYRSMWTSVNAGPDGDTINATQAWSTASLEGPNGGGGFTFDTYPTASSLNDYMVIADTSGYAHFAIAWVDRWAHYYSGEFYTYQANMQYAMDTFRLGWPQVYTFGGDDPQGTASPLAQRTRHAVLYETEIDSTDVMRTTRQFFAKSRPTGYVAKGRRTIVPIDLNSSTYFELLVHDPWIADDVGGTDLSWAPRDPSKKTDSVHQVEELMRSVYFSAGDSTAIGLELQAFFHGDSAEAPTARISLIAELVDSTNGSVIKQLDSIAVTAAADSQHVVLEPEYDLLSSTYYIRVRLDTVDLDVAPSEANQEIFHVSEYASLVPDPPAAKFARRLGPSTGNGPRISAQPNPFDARTEIRFSIPEPEEVSIVVIDDVGREVVRLVERAEYRAGRWAVEFLPGQLPSGSYIIELRAGRERAVERVIVR